MKKILFTFLVTFVFNALYSQNELPFEISERRKLNEKKLANKKEGWFVTGLPRASYDPIQGVGGGIDAEIFNNRNRNDPFFAYTPYREKYVFNFRYTQNGKISAGLKIDMPYFLNTKWRMRSVFAFADNPNKLYFGFGESSLDGLSYIDREGNNVENARYADYARNISYVQPSWGLPTEDPNEMYSYRRFNYLKYRKYAFDFIMERTFMEGDLRLVMVAGFTSLSYEHYDLIDLDDARDPQNDERVEAQSGRTLISLDNEASQQNPDHFWSRNNIMGFEGGLSIKMKGGLIYDTRDFEPDPSRGTLAEVSIGYTAPWMGSDFDYMRFQTQFMKFIPILNFMPNENTLAFRFMFSAIGGNQVFFREVLDIWSASQGRIGILGGEDSMRGYKKFRFGSMLYGFGNVEWRSSLFDTEWFNQRFAFSAVPFFDFGRVWDRPADIGITGFKYSPGMGLRIAWNQSTILRFDYARSAEDSQFFFVFGQIF